MWQDLVFALRSWTKAPTFALAAVGTLAIGIGAAATIVTVANGVLLRPLPFINPEQLVQINETQPRTASSLGFDGPIVFQDFQQWRAHSALVDRFVTYGRSRKNVRGAREVEAVATVATEYELFSVLGVAPALGRTFDASDGPNVAVASYDLWRAQFNSDPAAIGQSISIDGQPFTLVGVMPDGFQFPYRAASMGLSGDLSIGLWMPWTPPADLIANPGRRLDAVVARLKPGVTIDAARTELAGMQGPSQGQRLVRIQSLMDVVSGPARDSLLVLIGAVGLVLLVACVNVTNLFLARTMSRSSEIAVRAALGASRSRLIRQLLTESLLLASIAALLGLGLGIWGSQALVTLASARLPRAHEIGMDWRVVSFLFAMAVTVGIAFGLAPALIASRGNVSTIKRGGAAAVLRNTLVVIEIALAFVLLAGAGLLLRTFVNLQQTNAGVDAENVLTAHVVLSGGPEAVAIEERIARIPGVRAAGLISLLPLQRSGWSAGLMIDGRPDVHETELRYITPGYFRAMGIPLRSGRELSWQDGPNTPIAIVVNEALARQYFAPADPVGRKTSRGTIVGVVGDVRQRTLSQPATPEVYYSVAQNFAQLTSQGSTLVVRAEREPEQLIAAIRAAIREINPGQALFRVETMEGVVQASLGETRLQTWLVGAFAAMGLVLAMTGIYGVIAYLVALRTREFGIRMALGADTGAVLRLVLRHGLWLTSLGLVVGISLAVLLTRVLRGVLYGVDTTDPVTFGAMTGLLATAALAAYIVPARRASRVDPSIALRDS